MLKLLRKLFSKGSCPKCGWLVACDECSKKFDYIDEDIDKNS